MSFSNTNLQSSGVALDGISVVSGALVAFNQGISHVPQSQDDVLTFMLHSMLATNEKQSNFQDPQAWQVSLVYSFRDFQLAMYGIGFKSESELEWDTTTLSSDSTLSKVIVDKIDGESRDAVEQAMKSIGKSNNEEALRLLSSAAKDAQGKKVTLITGFCSKRTDASVIKLHGYFANTSDSNNNVLESGITQGTEISHVYMEAKLKYSVANHLRDRVKNKVGKHYRSDIKHVRY
ncbi:unnamed protein product [Rhizoctonia solani]|uniref:Uncharacterized protein n=1 Tax=Rhizoctonia solani TaxID=456999 RepID=A0A8H3H4N7_9AGAM|nr:unnamed protein product [Rhizoctonia solani]